MISHPFGPLVDENCRILILGSFPSVKSREDGFFYGHPRNRFWQVMAAILGENTPVDIPSKKSLLLRHHIALWDVIASCEIEGSSDASIKNVQPVDISQVLHTASIDRILCNGALSGKLYARYLLPITGIEASVLPSTSPANAAWSQDRLTHVWSEAIYTITSSSTLSGK